MKRKLTIKILIVSVLITLLPVLIFRYAHTHKWGEWTVLRRATCLSEGCAERKCRCGKKEKTVLPITDHTGEAWIIERIATAKESGKKSRICSVCNETLQQAEIPPLRFTLLPGITDTEQDRLRPSYELANCRTLKGNVAVVLMFTDDDQSQWTREEVFAFMRKEIMPGLDYLEKSARAWGVDLNFAVESYSTPLGGYELKYEGTVNPNLHDGGSTKDVTDQCAADIGLKSNWELYSYYKAMYPDNDVIFLNFLNKAGRSYARNSLSTGYLQYSEHCVIFADHLGGSPHKRKDGSRASTVAHEILHLFGAEDFYASYERARLASDHYPDDIMLWQYDDITDNRIGECTAFSIGWTNTAPDVCHDPQWWK